MRGVAWLGAVVLLGGLLLGGLLAGGMYAAEVNRRAQQTPEALVPVGVPAAVPLPAGAGDATRGHGLYVRLCAACHGATGSDTSTPLHGPLINAYYRDDRVLAGLIRNGVGTMPGTPADQLSDQGLADMIAFMRALP
jgi:mono/diheme cytochrome c family protein